MSKFGVPTEEQLAKINQLAKRTLTADEVFVFSSKAAGDLLIPHRHTRLSPEILSVMADDANKGVSFMYNHSWAQWNSKGVPYGKVFEGFVKSSKQENETTELHLSRYIVRDDEVSDGISANSLIKKIETGILSDTSIGWGTDVMTCSICGMNYYSRDCSHWRGQTYELSDGTKKVCTITAMPPSVIIPYNNNVLYEESIVWDGAYPGAAVTQSKHGDIIETPTGNFTVIQDKEELPEGTLFHGYYHNGDIVTMVKKSEHKKVFAVHEIPEETQGQRNSKSIKKVLQTIEKGGGKQMNEEFKKMLETFGVEIDEGKTLEELCNQLATAYASIPSIETKEGNLNVYMTAEQVKEKLGKELTADEVLKLAKEGQDYHKQVIDEAIAMGVRAQGNDFPADTWKNTFSGMDTKSIKDIMKTFEAQAVASIPSGRKTNPEAGRQSKVVTFPDEAYKVGK